MRNRPTKLVTLAFLALIGITAFIGLSRAQKSEISAPSRIQTNRAAEEIARSFEVHRADYLKGDANAWAAMYAEDAVFAGSQRNLEGRQAIQDYFAQVMRDFPGRTAAVSNLRIRVYNENAAPTAIVNVENNGTRTDASGRQVVLNSRESPVWVKVQGKWLIVDHHASPRTVSNPGTTTVKNASQTGRITNTSLRTERRDQPVTDGDLRILLRANELLKDESVWNRNDDRICDDDERADKRSFFCELRKACIEVVGKYDHRRAVLQEVRFVVEEATVGRNFEHQMKDFNNSRETRLVNVKERAPSRHRSVEVSLEE